MFSDMFGLLNIYIQIKYGDFKSTIDKCRYHGKQNWFIWGFRVLFGNVKMAAVI